MTMDPKDPRPAATLVILRDGAGGLEVLITIRPRALRFMGGAAVFPGGAVTPGDLAPGWAEVSNLTASQAADLLNEDPRVALGAFICALREAYEEVGFVSGSGPLHRIEREHASEGAGFLEHLADLGVVLDAASLVPAGRWVTPQPSPVRFDARFFVTHADPDWVPEPDAGEVERAFWSAPGEALQSLASGELVMAPPTIQVLQTMRFSATVAQAIASLRDAPEDSGSVLSAQVHPLVRMIVAPNPGLMTGPGTNTYVVGTRSASVIDPAVAERDYLDAVLEPAIRVESIFVTHRHPDHTGGLRALVELTGAPVRAWGTEEINGVAVEALHDGEAVGLGDARGECIHTPGHASDHVCLRLDDALFSGDTIVGEGTAVIAPPDGSLAAYLDSLRRLRTLGLEKIFPGHFRPVDRGSDLIDEYLDHRLARHRAILDLLGEGEASIDQIVDTIYVDTSPDLHPIARLTVLAHLEMARDDGQVVQDGQKWRATSK